MQGRSRLSAQAEQERHQAERQVARFVLRFEPAYKQLAYYAALPLVLTPELLHYLRNQFLRDAQLPWVAEADLLLSDLCYVVGHEQYAMDSAVRDYLMAEMEQALGEPRVQAAAKLLLRYVEQLESVNPYLGRGELQAQQMAAMVYVGEAQQQAVALKLAEEYQLAAAVGQQQLPLSAQAEMARLSRLTAELAPKLQAYPQLLDFAQLMGQLLSDPAAVPLAALEREYVVADGVTLDVPPDLKPDVGVAQAGGEFPGFPVLAAFDFIDAQLVDATAGDGEWSLPPLQTEEFTVVTFEAVTEELQEDALRDTTPPVATSGPDITPLRPIAPIALQPFDFTVATLQPLPARKGQKAAIEWEIQRQQLRASRWVEVLPGNGVLEMVSIPAGTFTMGSPEDEPERYDDEAPQHEVTVEAFLMGRYPVTQAQWRAVADLPQVARELEADPSEYKGDLRPVEQVSWYDAVEFCARLSAHTGREYRLPSEAQWEYACRAGATTPFHFGDIITTEVANYDGSAYADGPTGEERGETTPVDHFEIANAFGLSDMHGNVSEWCADHWHSNYDGAPTDGSAWVTDNEEAERIRRGGSWIDNPRYCRSAYRSYNTPEYRIDIIGFRVSCAAPRTP